MPTDPSLRDVPSIGSLLDDSTVRERFRGYSRKMLTAALRSVADRWRRSIRRGDRLPQGTSRTTFLDQVEEALEILSRPGLRPVINATGVILSTNLGRAPLARQIVENVTRVAGGYSSLETDLVTGTRGRRDVHVIDLLKRLTGSPAALVVNNNAAAVMLILNTFAKDRAVIVSRGELIEIGGSFRLPQVMAASGARLVEVGTTNRTYLEDYVRAITDQTALLFRSHTSNYRMVGFTHRPSLEELVDLGRRKGLLTVEDLGSGLLADFKTDDLAGEPTVRETVRSGVDLVCFSGDKLLGGPQCGIVLGRQRLVNKLRQNPLYRAVRLGKLTLAALEATLRLYLYADRSERLLPHLGMIRQPAASVRRRADRLLRQLKPEFQNLVQARLYSGQSAIGGGSYPGTQLATCLIGLRAEGLSASRLARMLRLGDPPVVGRIVGQRVMLDLRTVSSGELGGLRRALTALVEQVRRHRQEEKVQ
jgi:L-seryl-tRNA(Ser) seleniumtransferase